MDAQGRVAFLAGSVNRIRVLRELRERPGRGAELARRCSIPRSTVHRCLDGLLTHGWAEKSEGNYRITTAGTFVLAAYEDLTETVRATAEHGDALRHLDAVGRTLPIEALANATVVESTPAQPYAAMERFVAVHEGSSPERMCGVIPVASRSLNEAARPLVEANVEIEMVIGERVLDAAREAHPEAYQFGLDSDNFRLYVHPGEVPFGLAIFDDDRVLLGACDDRGTLRACIDGTDSTLVEWARETYERVRDEARPIEGTPETT